MQIAIEDKAAIGRAGGERADHREPRLLQVPGVLDVELRGRRYRARWAQGGTVEHLRVNVRVEIGSNGSGRMHVETLDLYSPRSRQVFAVRAARVLSASVDAIDEDLSELLVAIDRAQRAATEKEARAQVEPNTVAKMSDADRAEALALLKAPELIDRIARDMELLGYVGEDTNKKLGYLIAVSRKLPEPL